MTTKTPRAVSDGGPVTRDALLHLGQPHKTAAAEPEAYVVPRAGNRVAVEAIERWLAIARVQHGHAILRRGRKNGLVGTERLHPQSIATIIKRRVRGHLVRQGVPVAIAGQEADRYSGHSLRHGFTATAAEAGANLPAIKAVTGHKTDAIVGRYLEQADRIKTNAHRLPGVGLDSSR